MDEVVVFTQKVLDWPITVTLSPAGQDWNVSVLGGCQPHVGSVSLAEYNEGTVTLRTLRRDGHRDQEVGDRFARRLAQRCRCTVCVSCGIHYDNPTRSELERIVSCAEELLEQLCHALPDNMA